MSRNDVILLSALRERNREETSTLPGGAQDTYFFARHYLKNFNPSHDDLLAGIVDGTRDGGIDGAYIFVNGMCVRDDAPLAAMGKGADLQLLILQAKDTTGFKEDAVDRLTLHLPELITLDRKESALKSRFNNRVLEITRRFLTALKELHLPTISITVAFASFRAEQLPHPEVLAKGEKLCARLRECLGTSEPVVTFIDAAALSDLARFPAPDTKTLVLAENPISTDTSGGYIGVASLERYYEFISDDSGRIDANIFGSNVRDYDPGSAVNESIRRTLAGSVSAIDFWWLNNGVTIVASRIVPMGKQLQLEGPQIVNGLQTSHEIFRVGQEQPLGSERSVLVKVVEVQEDEARDRIIKATNSQTTLETSSLRATDQVQRKIEEYMRTIDLFYERRKNYYRNRAIPLEKLVSIEQMAQAVAAVCVQCPHLARGNVSKIFEEEVYPLAFNDSYPLELYGSAIRIMRACEAFLWRDQDGRSQMENYVFHLACAATISMTGKRSPKQKDIASLQGLPSDELLKSLLGILQRTFAEVANRRHFVLFDEVAKDALSTALVLEAMWKYLASGGHVGQHREDEAAKAEPRQRTDTRSRRRRAPGNG